MENTIEHYRQIDVIREIELEIEKSLGVKPFDISHWNSGDIYKSGMLSKVALDKLDNFLDYSYSYAYDQEILKKLLKLHPNAAECALSNSATSAIVAICATLHELGMNSVCLLNPSYFSTAECLKINGLSVNFINCEYDGIYHIPFEKIEKFHPDVVWITQPVFSTGTYLPTDELDYIAKKDFFLVCDASMCDMLNYPITKFDYDKCIVFFSPHKVVSINGVKFCYILCNKTNKTKIEDWGDIFTGNLPASSTLAINHFLSENYKKCLDYHNAFICESKRKIKKLTYNTPIESCGDSKGSYETFTIKIYPYVDAIDREIIQEIFRSTLVSFVPGCVNKFPKENGFCFRVNHTLDTNRISNAMLKIIKYCLHH